MLSLFISGPYLGLTFPILKVLHIARAYQEYSRGCVAHLSVSESKAAFSKIRRGDSTGAFILGTFKSFMFCTRTLFAK